MADDDKTKRDEADEVSEEEEASTDALEDADPQSKALEAEMAADDTAEPDKADDAEASEQAEAADEPADRLAADSEGDVDEPAHQLTAQGPAKEPSAPVEAAEEAEAAAEQHEGSDADGEDAEESEESDESEEAEAAEAAAADDAEQAEGGPFKPSAVEALEDTGISSDEPQDTTTHDPAAEDAGEVAEDEEPKVSAHRRSPLPEGERAGETAAAKLEGMAAYFEHPDHLLAAARHARDADYSDFDAYSPFPIHGMDEAMGLGRSWIPWVTFFAGIVGFLTANALQFGMLTFDWPMIIGGKPFAPWPSFVPIMFELTVLIGGVTTAVVMLKAAGCFKKPFIIDERITDDRFVLWIPVADEQWDEEGVHEFMRSLNPLEIKTIFRDA